MYLVMYSFFTGPSKKSILIETKILADILLKSIIAYENRLSMYFKMLFHCRKKGLERNTVFICRSALFFNSCSFKQTMPYAIRRM